MKLKQFAILFFTAMIGLVVMLVLSAHYWDSGNQKTRTDRKVYLTLQTVNISESCRKIEHKIRNSEIDKKLIEDELDKLNSIFEKNYLSALLKTGKGIIYRHTNYYLIIWMKTFCTFLFMMSLYSLQK